MRLCPQSHIKSQGQIRHIQVLRGIAVLLVIAFHAYEPLFPLGYLGVDIFFVISGFVISPAIVNISKARNIKEAWHRLKEFYSRRIMRLIPGFGIFILVSGLALLLLASLDDHPKISSQALFSIFGLGNVGAHFFSGNYFNPNPNPYIHLWSLAAEEQLYLFLPAIVILILRTKKFSGYIKRHSFLKLAAFSLLFVTMAVLCDSRFRILNLVSDYYSPFSKVWLFALGGFLTRSSFTLNYLKPRQRIIFQNSLIFVLIGIGTLIFSPLRLPQPIGLILASSFATIFIFLGKNQFFDKSLFSPLNYIGDRSYSIYLFHMPFFYLAKYSPLSGDKIFVRLSLLGIAAIFTFVLADLNYSYVENRYRMRSAGKNEAIWKIFLRFNVPAVALVGLMFIGSQFSYGLPVPIERAKIANPKTYDCGFELQDVTCFESSGLAHPYVLLLGDSHARQYLKVMKEVANAKKLNLVYAPIDIIAAGSIKNLDPKDQSKLLDIVQIRKPRYVMLSELVYAKSIGSDFPDSLNWLENHVSDVLVIGQSPRFSDKNRFMHYMYPSLISPFFVKEPAVNIQKGDLESDSSRAGQWLHQIAISSGFRFIDSMDVLCPSSECIRQDESGWLYVDDHHLSTHGADLMRKVFSSALR